ncbi:restriction endonuclease type II-like protein [Scheffersomyces amazonensis]|uniref:restriction endonuclease type II-like protein n=1 Tax=Scheffersomyces amazonensis TaxID=1078765 RepID=UPI00315CF2BE
MSEEGGNKDSQVDSTSFASILAGVQRMREQYEPSALETQVPQQSNTRITSTNTDSISVTTTRPTNISTTGPKSNRDFLRATLSETTGNPISPISASRSPTPGGQTTVRNSRSAGNVTKTAKVLVGPSQKGNPLFTDSLLKTVGYEFDKEILCDYFINPTFQILFLSIKYHKLKPEYLWSRVKRLNRGSSSANTRNDRALRILLVVVDIESPQDQIRNLTDFAIKHDLSMVLAWSFEEAGNYIAFSKQLDNAPARTKQGIQGIRGTDYKSCVVEAFTGIRSVNKTDVSNLLANYGSVKEIVTKSCNSDNITNISGMGATKIRNLKTIFSEPFIYNKHYEPLDE